MILLVNTSILALIYIYSTTTDILAAFAWSFIGKFFSARISSINLEIKIIMYASLE